MDEEMAGMGDWGWVCVVVLTPIMNVSDNSSSENTPAVHRKYIDKNRFIHSSSLPLQL